MRTSSIYYYSEVDICISMLNNKLNGYFCIDYIINIFNIICVVCGIIILFIKFYWLSHFILPLIYTLFTTIPNPIPKPKDMKYSWENVQHIIQQAFIQSVQYLTETLHSFEQYASMGTPSLFSKSSVTYLFDMQCIFVWFWSCYKCSCWKNCIVELPLCCIDYLIIFLLLCLGLFFIPFIGFSLFLLLYFSVVHGVGKALSRIFYILYFVCLLNFVICKLFIHSIYCDFKQFCLSFCLFFCFCFLFCLFIFYLV